MGTLACIFNNEQIGDYVEQFHDDIEPATPPLVLTGLYRDDARYVVQGKNLQHRVAVKIAIVRETPQAMSAEIARIQQLAGTTATFAIQADGEDIRLGEGWMLLPPPRPQLLDGHGGRFTRGWVLTFCGNSPIEILTPGE